ncbi:glycosyltransferase family 2 protein [Inquilinus sp. KBS0705]|nr:glycosyltransferase family 2 protein [Inquilinus sp. KBS0705]
MQIENLPLVTVIIPTKNRLPLLKNALNSVYQQTYKNLEIIVVDVCSDDGTAEFLKAESKKNKITVCTSDKIVKAGKARNIGIKAATGSLIAFLDDDDEWLPEKLSKQVPIFDDSETGMVYSGVQLVNVDQNLTYEVQPTVSGYIFNDLLIENKIGTTNTVVLRSSIIKELLFDEDLPAREEYDLWIRISKNHKITGLSTPLARIYSRNTLSRISSDVKNYVDAIGLINDKFKDDIEKLPADKRSKRQAEQLFFLASQSVKANNLSLARKYYFKSSLTKFSVKAAGSFVASFFGIKALLLMRKLKG